MLWWSGSEPCVLWEGKHGKSVNGVARLSLEPTQLNDSRSFALVSWGDDGFVCVWKVELDSDLSAAATSSLSPSYCFRAHNRPVFGFKPFDACRKGVSWSEDGTVAVFDLVEFQFTRLASGHQGLVTGADVCVLPETKTQVRDSSSAAVESTEGEGTASNSSSGSVIQREFGLLTSGIDGKVGVWTIALNPLYTVMPPVMSPISTVQDSVPVFLAKSHFLRVHDTSVAGNSVVYWPC